MLLMQVLPTVKMEVTAKWLLALVMGIIIHTIKQIHLNIKNGMQKFILSATCQANPLRNSKIIFNLCVNVSFHFPSRKTHQILNSVLFLAFMYTFIFQKQVIDYVKALLHFFQSGFLRSEWPFNPACSRTRCLEKQSSLWLLLHNLESFSSL